MILLTLRHQEISKVASQGAVGWISRLESLTELFITPELVVHRSCVMPHTPCSAKYNNGVNTRRVHYWQNTRMKKCRNDWRARGIFRLRGRHRLASRRRRPWCRDTRESGRNIDSRDVLDRFHGNRFDLRTTACCST